MTMMSEEDLAIYLGKFLDEEDGERPRAKLTWKDWCQALGLLLTVPIWGPLMLLVFGIDYITQLLPQKPKKTESASVPKYPLRVILEDGSEMTFTLNAPPKRPFVDYRKEKGLEAPDKKTGPA
jgi:hypothetical protein